MRHALRRGLGILLVPLPNPPNRPPIPLAALLLLPRRFNAFSNRSFCSHGRDHAVEQFSDDEYEDHRLPPLRRRAAIFVARSKRIFLSFSFSFSASHQMLTVAVVVGGEHRRVQVETEHAAAQRGGAGDHLQGPPGLRPDLQPRQEDGLYRLSLRAR